MPFCSHCKYLQATVFGQAVQSITYNLQDYPHQPSYTSLVVSANAGCGLCEILLRGLSDTERLKNSKIEIKFGDNGTPIYPNGELGIGGVAGLTGERWIWMDGVHRALGIVRACELPVGWEDPWGKDYVVETNDKAVAAIDYWAKRCLSEHPECQQIEPGGYIPTRVIEVGTTGDEHVRLIHPKDERLGDKRYVALSHCWGQNMPSSATTTQAALDDRLASIPLAHLTTTFVDAIKITRGLGIPYVWIDSLCIIQESSSDWEAEASAMAAVYTGAYVTLAASASSGGTEGCRVHNDEVPYIDVPMNGGELDPGDKAQRRYRVSAWPNFSFDHMNRDPLHARGWCLQERELSPRNAHFSRDTVRWECRKLQASLVFPWHDKSSFLGPHRVFDYDGTGRRHPKLAPTLSGVVSGDGLLQAASEWFRLVRLYTTRSLTKQTDILPALGGIARVFAGFTPGEYHAGHFVSHGIMSLLWRAETSDQEKKVQRESRRPEQYTAPSWSWASVVGAVGWTWNLLMDKDRIEGIAEVTEMKTELLGNDKFGKVKKGGMLKIKGQVRQLAARERSTVWLSADSGTRDLFANVRGRELKVGSVGFDVLSEAQDTIWAIACAKIGHPWPQVFGLALVSDNEEPERPRFRRIGRVMSGIKTWEEDAPVMEISII